MTAGPLEKWTSMVLRAGTYAGIAIMAVGLILSAADVTDVLLDLGIVVLVVTPMAGVLVSTGCLARTGDRLWVLVALGLMLTIAVGLLVSWYL